MIVKIQLPQFTSEPKPLAKIYNEDRSFEMHTPVTPYILEHMKGRPKAFFDINLREGNPLLIESEAPWQKW